MASELRVNTLKDASGNNSVGMSYVANGSAKAWWEANTSGTQTVNDSLNVASITDEGTGLSTIAWTSAFGTDQYTTPLGRSGNSNNSAFFVAEGYAITASAFSFVGKFSDNSSINLADMGFVSSSHHGDLA